MNHWNEQLKQFCNNCRYFYGWNQCRRWPPDPKNGAILIQNPEHSWCGEWQPQFGQDKLEPTSI